MCISDWQFINKICRKLHFFFQFSEGGVPRAVHPHVVVPYSLVVACLGGKLCHYGGKSAAFAYVHHVLRIKHLVNKP